LAPLSGNNHKNVPDCLTPRPRRDGFFPPCAATVTPITLRGEIMSRNPNVNRRLAALGLLALAAACSKKQNTIADTAAVAVVAPDTTAAVAVTAAPGAPVSLTVASKPGVGVYLTDASGRAVYVLDDGTGATIACTGPCSTALQPVAGNASKAAGDTALSADLIGVTTLPDGTVQVTYAGKPLYYASQDQSASSTSAQGSRQGKATSYLVSPKGTEIKSKAKA
jgi:predicted lipoprotein with Yx(FWY)xxD motif